MGTLIAGFILIVLVLFTVWYSLRRFFPRIGENAEKIMKDIKGENEHERNERL